VFDDVRYGQDVNYGSYEVDSVEAHWNSNAHEGPNLGHKVRPKEGYFPVPPNDTLMDMRSEMSLVMEEIGLTVECHHHEVATAGQCEIDMKFDTLLKMADDLIKYKYVVKNVARMHGKTATFMPKPLYGDNGSGMHVHQSIWNGDDPTFGDEGGFAKLSDNCRYYIGGLLKHAPAVLAFAAPTTNSYHRLVPGYEAPVNLAWSLRNRSAAVRIPMYSDSLKAKRCEFRCPDPSANPYLAFSAMLMAGIDGIKRSIRAIPSTRTSMTCRRKSLPKCRAYRVRSTKRSQHSRKITTSSPRATCSPRTLSRITSATNAKRKWMPFGCVHILMSS